MAGPLQGIRVLELAQFAAGPAAGLLLADMGAEVIKVEAPQGDPTRERSLYEVRGESAYFKAQRVGDWERLKEQKDRQTQVKQLV